MLRSWLTPEVLENGNSMEIQRKWHKQEVSQGETHAILINIQMKNKNK